LVALVAPPVAGLAPEFVEELVPLLVLEVVLLLSLFSGARVVAHPDRSKTVTMSMVFMPDSPLNLELTNKRSWSVTLPIYCA
jgi:hypothetical protein